MQTQLIEKNMRCSNRYSNHRIRRAVCVPDGSAGRGCHASSVRKNIVPRISTRRTTKDLPSATRTCLPSGLAQSEGPLLARAYAITAASSRLFSLATCHSSLATAFSTRNASALFACAASLAGARELGHFGRRPRHPPESRSREEIGTVLLENAHERATASSDAEDFGGVRSNLFYLGIYVSRDSSWSTRSSAVPFRSDAIFGCWYRPVWLDGCPARVFAKRA